MAYNVTARPLKVILKKGDDDDDTYEITEFPADTDPIRIENIMYGDPVMDVNGNVVRKRKYLPIKLVMAIIPGTDSEKSLSGLVYDELMNGKNYSFTLTLNFAGSDYRPGNSKLKTEKFEHGKLLGSSWGYEVGRDGAAKTKEFHFVFKTSN